MDKVYIFVVVFVIIYLLYFFTVVLNNKKKSKIFETSQAKLITVPNKLDTNKIDKNIFAQVISISNSFIVAFTFLISEFFNNYIVKLLVCFVVLIILILIVYKIIGFVYKKKEGR